jgi:hypothetical protein
MLTHIGVVSRDYLGVLRSVYLMRGDVPVTKPWPTQVMRSATCEVHARVLLVRIGLCSSVPWHRIAARQRERKPSCIQYWSKSRLLDAQMTTTNLTGDASAPSKRPSASSSAT